MKRRILCIGLTAIFSFAMACTNLNGAMISDDKIIVDNTETVSVSAKTDTEKKDNTDDPVDPDDDLKENSGENAKENNTLSGENNTDPQGKDTTGDEITDNEVTDNEVTDKDKEVTVEDANKTDTTDKDKKSDNSDDLNNENEKDTGDINNYNIKEATGFFVAIKNAVVRGGPYTDFDKLGTLSKDDVVEITGESENGWYRFKYNDTEGYTYKKFFIDKETYDAEQAQIKKQEEEAKEKAALEAQKKAEEEKRKKEEAEAAKQAQAEAENADPNSDATSSQTVDDQTNSDLSFASQVVAICNEYRAANGLSPLTEDGTLDSKALVRAGEIITNFDHVRPDGSSCFSILDDYSWTACGENIAAGQTTPREVVNAWMNSEGHRANILNPSFNKIGVGYTTGGPYGSYWVQIFTD